VNGYRQEVVSESDHAAQQLANLALLPLDTRSKIQPDPFSEAAGDHMNLVHTAASAAFGGHKAFLTPLPRAWLILMTAEEAALISEIEGLL